MSARPHRPADRCQLTAAGVSEGRRALCTSNVRGAHFVLGLEREILKQQGNIKDLIGRIGDHSSSENLMYERELKDHNQIQKTINIQRARKERF